ncbi:MAG: hypothetical protein ACXWLR_07260 [Myxococcales bacterium]
MLLRFSMLLALVLLALAAWIDVLLFLHSSRGRRSKPLYLDQLDEDVKEPRAA